MNSSISIAMATYNGGRHIASQLDSLKCQTTRPAEIIICDDGSTDNTIDLINQFAYDSAIPVRLYVNPQRLGYAKNFLKAISLCHHEYVAMCDQDDIWLPTKCEHILEKFQNSTVSVVSHNFEVFFEDERPHIASYFQYMEGHGYPKCTNIKGCSTAFRRSVFESFKFDELDDSIPHDYAISIMGYLAGGRGYIEEPLMRHRIHGSNTSGYIPKSRFWAEPAIRRALTWPRGNNGELEYILWVGVNSEVRRGVEWLLYKGYSLNLNQNWRRLFNIIRTVEYSSQQGSSLITRSIKLGRNILLGYYQGSGWMLGLAKNIARIRETQNRL